MAMPYCVRWTRGNGLIQATKCLARLQWNSKPILTGAACIRQSAACAVCGRSVTQSQILSSAKVSSLPRAHRLSTSLEGQSPLISCCGKSSSAQILGFDAT